MRKPTVWVSSHPVCGCDGATYDNGCQAAFLGVNVNHAGACTSGLRACGGISGGTCGQNQYCMRPTRVCSLNVTGVCVDKPASCPATHDPVCGCNDVTYGNACQAAVAGMSVGHSNACGPQRRTNGGSRRH